MLKVLKYIFNQLTAPEYGRERSPKWETVRNKYVKNNPYCALCGEKSDVEVHHVKPFHKFPEFELDSSNLITLCRPHHLLAGHLMDWSSYNPNVREDCLIWRDKIRKRPQGVNNGIVQ